MRTPPARPAPDAPAPPGVRERILTTATDLFYREGVRAVGIQRVIEEADIAKASLYAHYKSKDDLVAACVERRGCAWRTIVEERLSGPGDGRTKLLKLFDLVAEWVASPGFRGCPLQNAVSEIAETDHPARIVAATHRQWLRDLITALVRDAGIDAVDEAAGTLIVLHDGAAASALVDANPAAAQHARRAAERLLDAYASRPTPAPARPVSSARRPARRRRR